MDICRLIWVPYGLICTGRRGGGLYVANLPVCGPDGGQPCRLEIRKRNDNRWETPSRSQAAIKEVMNQSIHS